MCKYLVDEQRLLHKGKNIGVNLLNKTESAKTGIKVSISALGDRLKRIFTASVNNNIKI